MSPTPDVLVHLCSDEEWRRALACGVLRPDSLRTVGFVHLSTPQQVHLPANRLYAGRTDLVLLSIDPARLTSPVRWERGVPSDPVGMVFPHLYGSVPVSAVFNVASYRPDADGLFPPLENVNGRTQ